MGHEDNIVERRQCRVVRIGSVEIGGDRPIAVQSMTNTRTRDVESTVAQILRLEAAGCDLVRLAVDNVSEAKCIGRIKEALSESTQDPIPIIADLHREKTLDIARAAIEEGVDKIRVNPGNFTNEDDFHLLVDECKIAGTAMRIGVNLGSLGESAGQTNSSRNSSGMAAAAKRAIEICQQHDFHQVVLAAKSSDVVQTVKASELLAKQWDYPLHLGVTEAGRGVAGTVKSAIGIGMLLAQGLGDTIRVSLSDEPEAEVKAAWEILKAVGARNRGVTVISCPTCSRTRNTGIDVKRYAEAVELALADSDRPLKIAVMGCSINGLNEAADADLGITGYSAREGKLFTHGQTAEEALSIPQDQLLAELLHRISAAARCEDKACEAVPRGNEETA